MNRSYFWYAYIESTEWKIQFKHRKPRLNRLHYFFPKDLDKYVEDFSLEYAANKCRPCLL